MSLFKPEHMSIEEVIEKIEEAVNLGDSPHRGPSTKFYYDYAVPVYCRKWRRRNNMWL